MNNPIYPCIWCDGNAAEVAAYYCQLFPNSTIINENELVVQFELNGNKMMVLNGGPAFKPTEAVSFVIECENQTEIDFFWDNITKDGAESMCGWAKDKFGVSWQIIPAELGKWMKDPIKGKAVIDALLQMKKIDINVLLQAG